MRSGVCRHRIRWSFRHAPNSKFVFTDHQKTPNTIDAYTVSASGKLTLVTGSPFPAGTTPFSLAVDSTSQFLYVANINSSDVWAYRINHTTGALTKIKAYTTDLLSPDSIAVDPTGRFLLVTVICCGNPGAGVTVFTINPSSGTLSPVTGSPFALPSGMGSASAVTVDPTGRFAYVCGGSQSGLSGVVAFSVNSNTGALTLVTPAPVLGGVAPWDLAVDPEDRFLYMTNNDATISGYSIDNATGVPTQISRSPFLASGATRGIVVDPSDKFVYLVDASHTLGYSIDTSTGSLTLLPSSPFASGLDPISLTVSGTVK